MSAPVPKTDKELFERTGDYLAGRKHPAPHWYELDILAPFHDVVALVGFALLVGGVAMFSHGGALIVAGAGLLALGWMMAKSA